MRQKRYDKITLDRPKAIKLDNGMMKIPARISRVGVQEYRRADGSLERAYRPTEEVSAQRSLDSFVGAPLVNDHPYADGGVVTAANVKRLGVGHILNPVFRDGFVEAIVVVEDAEAVAAVESGKVELSAGYFIERDETPGVTPDGQPYDFVQRDITGNHVAIVDHGRAGADVRLQLDASVAFATDLAPIGGALKALAKGEPTMKFMIDSVECDVNETTAQLIGKERAAATAALEAVKAESVKLTAQLDASKDQITKLEAALKEAPAKAKVEIVQRASLESKAKKLAPDVKCDGLDDQAVKRAVCEKAGVKCDGKDATYVDVRFDILVEDAEKKNPATEAAQRELTDPSRNVTDEAPQSSRDARKQAERDFFNPTKK